MSPLYFLLSAIVLSAIGLIVLWLVNRPSEDPESSVEQFNSKMSALAPPNDDNR